VVKSEKVDFEHVNGSDRRPTRVGVRLLKGRSKAIEIDVREHESEVVILGNNPIEDAREGGVVVGTGPKEEG
jgi:hypothetical protein